MVPLLRLGAAVGLIAPAALMIPTAALADGGQPHPTTVLAKRPSNHRKVTGLRVTAATNQGVDLAWRNPKLLSGDRIVVRRGASTPGTPRQGHSPFSSTTTTAHDTRLAHATRYTYSVFVVDRRGQAGPRVSIAATTRSLRTGGLDTDDVLRKGERVRSPNGQYFFIAQDDGNLVEYVTDSGRSIWDSGTLGKGGVSLEMQPDGNLVLYTADWKAVWASGTDGTKHAHFEVQNDGNLVVYGDGVAKGLAQIASELHTGERLTSGEALHSPDGRYELVMQSDGNLVEYLGGKAQWASATSGDNFAIMQSDGNLVVYRVGGGSQWASGTDGRSGAHLAVQNDGNVVVYQNGTAYWASHGISHGGVLGDDYPKNLKSAAQDSTVDPWGFYNRECTSFVAWRLNNANKVSFSNNMVGPNGAKGHFGNANEWKANAVNIGYSVDNTPAVGAVAWWASGHVAWVAAVGDGTVTIEEYNRSYNGTYSSRQVATSSVGAFLHIKDM